MWADEQDEPVILFIDPSIMSIPPREATPTLWSPYLRKSSITGTVTRGLTTGSSSVSVPGSRDSVMEP